LLSSLLQETKMSNTRVYVGGLSHRCRESDLERFFRKYGRLREISIKNGYAFVDFDDGRDADDAVYDLNGVDFMGDRVTVEFAKGTPHGSDRMRYGYRSRSRSRDGGRGGGDRGGGRPVWLEKYGPPTRTEYRVVVENLSSRVSWQDLKDFMRTAGEVTYADAHKNRRNEGVVEFASRSDLKRALDKLDDTELNGRRIRIVDVSKKGGSRSRSRSGRKSRSRSRSRRSRSRSKRSRSRSKRSRSKSGRSKKSKSGSGGRRSRSRSKSSKGKSRSRSGSGRSRSRSAKSRSRSEKSRSRSRSPKKEDSDKD